MLKISALRHLLAALLFAGVMLPQLQAVADDSALQKQIDDLRENQKAIQNQLQEIRALLFGKPSAQAPDLSNLMINLYGHPSKGNSDAKLFLVDFSDYQCPFCARFFAETLPHIEKDYIFTGKLKYVFRDFPLQMVHPEAFKAHEAAHCAGDQKQYWQMHDRLYQNQQQLRQADLMKYAEAMGLNLTTFQSCLSSGKHADRIRKNTEEGQKFGVQGTPTLFLGVENGDSQGIKVLDIIQGAQPYLQVKEIIERALQAQVKR